MVEVVCNGQLGQIVRRTVVNILLKQIYILRGSLLISLVVVHSIGCGHHGAVEVNGVLAVGQFVDMLFQQRQRLVVLAGGHEIVNLRPLGVLHNIGNLAVAVGNFLYGHVI